MFHVSVFPHVFLVIVHEIDTAAEVYLEPFQIYMIGIFCEKSFNNFWLLTRIKAPPQKTGMVLITPLSYRDFRGKYLILR